MKTPEEIKKGLEMHALDEPCTEHSCHYYGVVSGKMCTQVLTKDALAYIQQLERENKDLLEERELNEHLRDKVQQLEAAHRTEYCEDADYDCIALGEARKRAEHFEGLAKAAEQIRWERDVAIDQLRQLGVGFGEKVEAQVPKWISVEERLPEVSDVVLVIANGKPREHITLHNAYLIASYWGEEGWIADGFEGWDKLAVTHWMPLPEGPKEG